MLGSSNRVRPSVSCDSTQCSRKSTWNGIEVGLLTENETSLAWRNGLEAEIRSLYFGEQAVRYTKRKQFITGLSFFLSSGTVGTLLASSPKWIPTTLALMVTAMSAYSMAVGLDRRVNTISKLHSEWNHLQSEYENLWNHWYEDEAQKTLSGLLKRGRDASQIATELPYDPKAIKKWEEFV